MKNLISIYTRLAYIVYSGEVKGEVGMRSRMRDLVPTSLLPPHYIQYTQVECKCLLSFSFINLKIANEKCRNM